MGDSYYPMGGMYDFLNDFDTIEECENAIDSKIKDGFDSNWKGSLQDYMKYVWDYSWAQVWDTETRKEVHINKTKG
jgi:hypothetical protein